MNRLTRTAGPKSKEEHMADFERFCDTAIANLKTAIDELAYAYLDSYGAASYGDPHWQNVVQLRSARDALRQVMNNVTRD